MNSGEGETHLSVFGDGAQAEDFPVLKAFQQYIDAEQAKARKRMIGLSIVFGFVLVVFIAAFILVVGYVNQQASKLAERNQALNDRLIEYAMKQQERPAAQPADNGAAALKAVTESLAQLQTQMIKQQQAAITAAQKVPQAAPKPESKPTVNESDIEKLRRATELLKDEKAKIALEKERLHREEVERQRRRLYPEFYARQDALKRKAEQGASEDIDNLLEDVEDMQVEDEPVVVAPKPRKTAVKKPTPAKKPAADKKPAAKIEKPAAEKTVNPEDDAIDYFKDDSFVIPKEGSKAAFRVPFKS